MFNKIIAQKLKLLYNIINTYMSTQETTLELTYM